MKEVINFNIELPSECFKHLKDISFYDHNYYSINTYVDWFYGDVDTLLVQYHEYDNYYGYSLGKIIDGKFKSVIHWNTNVDIFE